MLAELVEEDSCRLHRHHVQEIPIQGQPTLSTQTLIVCIVPNPCVRTEAGPTYHHHLTPIGHMNCNLSVITDLTLILYTIST